MRRKARPKKASPRGARGNANSDMKAKENTSLKVLKQIGRPTKTPAGRGLGKAGAKRLGRLLKQAIQEESTVSGKVSLPKTPVRLFKHQVQIEAENALKTNTAKPASSHVSQLILSMVSQCKHQGGISMAELKQTLASAGYNVTKNSKQMNMVTKRVVINETLVRTTRSSSFRLNNKKQTDTQVMTSTVKSTKQKADHPKQSKTASKSTKGPQWSQRQARKTPKPQGKLHKPKSKTRKTAAKSHKKKQPSQRGKTQSHRRITPKARRKTPKPAGKKRSPQRAQRSRQKQKKYPNKSSRKRQPLRQRLHKRRSRVKTQQRQVTRRRAYYY